MRLPALLSISCLDVLEYVLYVPVLIIDLEPSLLLVDQIRATLVKCGPVAVHPAPVVRERFVSRSGPGD